MNDEIRLEIEVDNLRAKLQAAEDDNLRYREQREMDVGEIQRLHSVIEEMHDWQGKAIDQMQRVLWSWDNEIDANIIAELDKLADIMAEGKAQMGEL